MQLSRRALLTSASVLSVFCSPLRAANLPTYRDAHVPISKRVADLLSRMTLEEKVAQLQCIWFTKGKLIDNATGAVSIDKAKAAFPNGVGQIARPSDTAGTSRYSSQSFRSPEDAVEFMNDAQRFAVEHTRLGIPLLFHEETAHGVAIKGATMLPIPTALGSTWEPELIEEAFTLVARQARIRGITVGLSPVVDVLRDPRWGRSEEFFGEDPFHVSQMGAAAVRGLQGRSRPLAPDRIFATLKHFIHGTPQNGLNVGPSDMSERMLREVYFPSFKRSIQAGAAIVMPSYNEVAGVPAHANRELLQVSGRDLLGFKGAYFSDYGGVGELASLHAMAADQDEAAILAINAGVDVDMPEGFTYARLVGLVRAGRVEQAVVDAAVSRVLALKFEAGLFEHPYVDPRRAARVLQEPSGSALALTLAVKSLVLLKNDGILPLDPQREMRLAVIGPNGVQPMRGGYAGEPIKAVGVLEGLRAAAGPNVVIEQADGAWITQPGAVGTRPEVTPIKAVPAADNRQRIAQAVELATRSDVIVLCVGDNESVTREAVAASLPGDRSTLNLFGDQDALVEALLSCGKPIVAVLINGRPLAVTRLADSANALIEAWYPGEQGGHAIAQTLFGKVSPGGKLPVAFPRNAGELPGWYGRHPSADKVPYVEGKRTPLFPFGFGLSYTTFEVSEPRLDTASIKVGDSVTIKVDVTNTGARDGDEVVQIYIRDMVSSVPRPTLELRAFRRVSLAKGEKMTLSFQLDADALAFWNADMKWAVEPGAFTIFAGNSTVNLKKARLTVV